MANLGTVPPGRHSGSEIPPGKRKCSQGDGGGRGVGNVAAAESNDARIPAGPAEDDGYPAHRSVAQRREREQQSGAPHYANYEESKANPYPALPDPLVVNDGKKVTRAAMWPARRAEIQAIFDREIYGRIPAVMPEVTWEVVKVDRSSRVGGIINVPEHRLRDYGYVAVLL